MNFTKSLVSVVTAVTLATNFIACGSDDTTELHEGNISDTTELHEGNISDTTELHEGNISDTTELHEGNISDAVITEQRAALLASTTGKSAPAQSPRDIDSLEGNNSNNTIVASSLDGMRLCDIHFHKSAEHKGGEFTKYAGNGYGEGYGTGYKYSGTLSSAELTPYTIKTEHNPLSSGDTIEVHYVYSSNNQAILGHGLGTCLIGITEGEKQPKLRVESQVYVLVNDANSSEHNSSNFEFLNKVQEVNGSYQAVNIPNGEAVHYEGSTTGPGYNETYSPYQVTWNVRTKVKKVNIKTVEKWFEDNDFAEEHAHGVRNLVINPALLSKIEQ